MGSPSYATARLHHRPGYLGLDAWRATAKDMTDKAKLRIGRLDSVGGVVREMAKVYREARRGELKTEEGTRLIYMLREIRGALEGSELERRVAELEGDR